MERFYIAFNRFDAYLLLHRLQHAGITAHVFNEHMQSIVGDVPPDVAQPQVWLERAADRSRAERVLADLQSERRQSGTLHCAACGEDNPGNFELCWRCGGSLSS
jgi:hypothetical protein